MLKFFDKIKFYFKFLFYAMRAGDSELSAKKSYVSNGDSIIEKHVGGGVFSDLLEEKVTKEVEELRDKNYRVFRKANEFDMDSLTMEFDANGNYVFRNTNQPLRKKGIEKYMKRITVYGEEDIPVRMIQDNKIIGKEAASVELFTLAGMDYCTTLGIGRGDFQPRFELEKYVKKMVVRQHDGDSRAVVDLYLPATASQFGKIDAILISNLYTMMNDRNFRSDIVDFNSFEWFSDHAWNCDDASLCLYDDIKMVDINLFDGSFVLSFDCHVVADGVWVGSKYETKELTEKYNQKAPKNDVFQL